MNPKPLPQTGQFQITTLLSWTAVAAIFFAVVSNLTTQGTPPGLVFLLIIFAPPLTCIPKLIDQYLIKNKAPLYHGTELSLFWRIWMLFCVAIYSMFALLLASIAFAPNWKGQKGDHWLYYLLDGWAGMTLWPVYLVGAIFFIDALFAPARARRSILSWLAILTNALISFWYVISVLAFNFSNGGFDLALVPGAAGTCYAIYAAILWKNREFQTGQLNASTVKEHSLAGFSWLAALTFLIVIKIPLTIKFYETLPDENPSDCFVVTAATRGHRKIVGVWFDESRQCWLNQQLLTFWDFELRWQKTWPRSHRILRGVYNRIGPWLARSIVFRWQADLVYIALKPLERLVRHPKQKDKLSEQRSNKF